MRLGAGFLMLLAAGGGWYYRAELRALLDRGKVGALASVPVKADVQAKAAPVQLYRWVDDNGVTHFEDQAGKGHPVKADGSGITPIEALGPGDVLKAEDLARKAEAGGGSQGLQRLRDELKAGAERLQEGKVAAGL